MSGLVYFSSASGNTARFVARLELDDFGIKPGRIPISPADPMPDPATPFVLIVPTFADGQGRGAVPKQVIRFLNDPDRRALLRGVIAGGNRNFGATYGLAGKAVSEKCNVPLLYTFELAGTETDITRVRAGLVKFWGMECSIPA